MEINKFIDAVKEMTVLELSEVVKALEKEFGVSAAAPMAFAAAPAPTAAPVEEEKSSFDIVLTSAGQTKINVIKVVKAVTGLGLKEAKDLVDGAPKVVKSGVSANEAKDIERQLKEAGAEVELK